MAGRSARRALVAACLASLAVSRGGTAQERKPGGDGVVWPADRTEIVDLAPMFEGIDGEGAFVLLDAESGRVRVFGTDRSRRRALPASTFKIPNTLIALETGVVDGPEFTLPFDSAATPPQPRWPRSWPRDHTLRSAFRNSVVWYYRELARRVGPERMAAWLERLAYGNGATSPAVDRFWLDGDLRISPQEQVEFLRRLWAGELPVSERSASVVRELMTLDEGPGWRLYGKTGTAEVTPTRELGWLVGTVERERGDATGADLSVFALYMEGERVWEEWPPDRRAELVERILLELGALPARAGRVPSSSPAAEPDRWLLAFLDVETTGLVPGWHEMIDLGLVVTDLEGAPVDSLFLRIQPEHPERASEGAIAVNAFDPDRWRELGALDPGGAADSLARFQRRVAGDRSVMLVAFNRWFDTAFLDHLFRGTGRSWRELYHDFVMDVPSMAWSRGLRGLTGSALSAALGVPDEPHVAEDHTGLTGARLNARLYRALLRERSP
jgi:beta-lactamase class D